MFIIKLFIDFIILLVIALEVALCVVWGDDEKKDN